MRVAKARVRDEREFGLYLVTGKRLYRGHEPGTKFVANLARGDARHSLARGDIRLLRRVVPALDPERFTFPEGWLDSPPQPVHRGAERRLTH